MPMHSLSAFQLLPPHVVRRIVDRVVRKTRLLYGCVWEDTVEYKKLLRPLLLVCSSFRAVAYPLYCCRFDLGLSSVLNDGSEPWVTRSNPFGLPYPTLHLVKDLYMNTVEISFYSGEALEALSRTLVGSCVFPLVQNLTICIAADVSDDEDGPSVHGLYNAIDPGTVDANISAFVQRVKEMMPMLSKVRLEFKIGSHLPIRRHTGRLILQIFQLAGRIEYIDPAEEAVPFALEAGGTRQMTHIKCNIMNFDGQFMLLVRLNAPTLQSLDLGGKLTHPASALIRNDDGSHVTYPQLATLSIWWSGNASPQLPVFGRHVVPFPSLRCAGLTNTCLFGDDTLFRGNTATLERLTLQLDAHSVDMLCRHQVFTLTSHPNLWYVNISYDSQLVPGTFVTSDEFMQFSLSIGPGAAVRLLSDYFNTGGPEPTLALLGSHANIQILALGVVLDIWQCFALVKLLPLLSDLCILHLQLGAPPADITVDELSAYVIATYAPIGKRFRCLDVMGNIDLGNYASMAKSALLLALVCPGFRYLVTRIPRDAKFKDEVEKAIDSDMFKQYAPRLQNLVIYSCDDLYE